MSNAVVSGPRPLSWREWPSWARVNALAVGVGGLAGGLASLLYAGVHLAERLLLQRPLGLPEGLLGTFRLGPWGVVLILIIPALGGLAVGLIARYACPEAAGSGTGQILRAYHHHQAALEGRVVPYKWLTSCLTLGTGGAGGTEGPAAQIGAATASWLSGLLGLGTAERGLLFTAGVAGGIGAIFRAPLGGALFACELYYSSPELEDEALLPSLVAAVSAYFVFGLSFGFQSLLPGDTPFTLSLTNFAALGFTGLLCALGARAYVGWMDFCSERFKRALPHPWRPALGGLLTGAVALAALWVSRQWMCSDARVLAVLGEGYTVLGSAAGVGTPYLLLVLLLVGAGKLLASGLTIGSGGSAGVFAPSMVIGGCLGGVVFIGLHALGLGDALPKAYVLAGMAAFFSAGTACPLASLIIITEVAQGYSMLPALMWVVAVGYLLRPRPGLFKDQVPGSADSPVHQAELRRAFLARRVGDLCRRAGFTVRPYGRRPATEPVPAAGQQCVPTVDAHGRYLGATAVRGARRRSTEAVPAALGADQSLGTAFETLKGSGAGELPVVDAQGRFVGLFSYVDMLGNDGATPASAAPSPVE